MLPARKFYGQNFMPDFFNDFFGNMTLDGSNAKSPAVNVVEDDKRYTLEVAAPGMSKEDFKISVVNNYLDISVERKEEKDEKCEDKKCEEEKYLRREFSYTRFDQRLLLPDNVKEDEIEAKMKHGILRITIPKDVSEPQETKMKQIEVK